MQNEEDSVYLIECVWLTQPAFLIIIDINKSLEPLWPSTYASVPYKKPKDDINPFSWLCYILLNWIQGNFQIVCIATWDKLLGFNTSDFFSYNSILFHGEISTEPFRFGGKKITHYLSLENHFATSSVHSFSKKLRFYTLTFLYENVS